ncbi:MAG: sigma factor-like helix-turn-helix DNA-binding protein [Candidatus Aenigmatarchaeota archaeon]
MSSSSSPNIEIGFGTEIPWQERAANLQAATRLSEQESEVYVLTEEAGMTHRDVAEFLGIDRGAVSRARHRVKRKISEAERTAELEI